MKIRTCSIFRPTRTCAPSCRVRGKLNSSELKFEEGSVYKKERLSCSVSTLQDVCTGFGVRINPMLQPVTYLKRVD